ncbi:putative toxin-antitoxin system toxin component, PIN family [Acerihabitans arboris]|uniref:putative toxin-antitoxin system toxin component, PIN family n=1 Tax=Acerihabitans arboris TaxID=2691583 RepID=UPI001C498C02|nr:putative toxin-antitoxin system toxin component, PIN family [Acerihabitans arboris]
MSEETLTELSEALARSNFDRYVSREDRQNFLRLLGGIVRVIPITQRIAACRDPKDDKFLDVALNGEVQLILSGDDDLLVLLAFYGIEFLKKARD